MASDTYRNTAGARLCDAFYQDEFGVINDETNTFENMSERKGFHKSRFTTTTLLPGGKWVEVAEHFPHPFENQANPEINKSIKFPFPQKVPVSASSDIHQAQIYFSDDVKIGRA